MEADANFKLRKIHTGFVVVLRNGERALAMRYDRENRGDNLVLLDPKTGWIVENTEAWDPNTLNHIVSRDKDIMRVYGYVSPVSRNFLPNEMLSTSTAHRKLLWSRKEVKKMTVSQICAALGYEVEIVKEET